MTTQVHTFDNLANKIPGEILVLQELRRERRRRAQLAAMLLVLALSPEPSEPPGSEPQQGS